MKGPIAILPPYSDENRNVCDAPNAASSAVSNPHGDATSSASAMQDYGWLIVKHGRRIVAGKFFLPVELHEHVWEAHEN
ncbi:MAG: hypothetical protein LCH86_05615 [Proteobacteria bacterium]|nr:hypothetical protein [Pseudomonadota bacterium]